VKGKPLINILGVSASGAVFLSTHDYLDRYKTCIIIADALLKTIQEIGSYNVIQVIIDNVANCKEAREIIEDRYPNIFWLGCLVHTMNLLMHDIIKMKDHDYRWIGALYKREKKMIRFITNHSMAHYIFRSHSNFELIKIAKTRFASYYLTFRRLLKVREALASMASSDSWQDLKDRATSASKRSDFQEVRTQFLMETNPDNNPEETNLEDGTIVLERLEEGLLSDHDGDHIPRGDMPSPSTSRVLDSSILPSSS
jgi:hypothetical protein